MFDTYKGFRELYDYEEEDGNDELLGDAKAEESHTNENEDDSTADRDMLGDLQQAVVEELEEEIEVLGEGGGIQL